jgi:hypothetical protein
VFGMSKVDLLDASLKVTPELLYQSKLVSDHVDLVRETYDVADAQFHRLRLYTGERNRSDVFEALAMDLLVHAIRSVRTAALSSARCLRCTHTAADRFSCCAGRAVL